MANELITITAGDYTDVALPVPSTYKVLSSTIVDSGRNSEGKVVGGIIRNSVRSIEISWNFLTRQQFSDLARLFDKDLYNKIIIDVEFIDHDICSNIYKELVNEDYIQDILLDHIDEEM